MLIPGRSRVRVGMRRTVIMLVRVLMIMVMSVGMGHLCVLGSLTIGRVRMIVRRGVIAFNHDVDLGSREAGATDFAYLEMRAKIE
jgi:hypothetical protein